MKPELIYWDANAFLGALLNEPGRAAKCAGTIERAKLGELVIVTSALTIAEVLWLRGGPKLPKKRSQVVRDFFKRRYLRVVNVTRKVAHDAQDLVWNNNVRPKDGIHVATAIIEGVHAIETFDGPLISLTGKISGLVIREPLPPVQPTLGADIGI